jgi:hypothetical protein
LDLGDKFGVFQLFGDEMHVVRGVCGCILTVKLGMIYFGQEMELCEGLIFLLDSRIACNLGYGKACSEVRIKKCLKSGRMG